ncbi:MAG: hypothetical protein P8Z50_01380, partial [candidate division WOR-3 bacterium]
MGIVYTSAASIFLYLFIAVITKDQGKKVKRIIYYSALPLCLMLSSFVFYKTGLLTKEYFKDINFFALYAFIFLFSLAILILGVERKRNMLLIYPVLCKIAIAITMMPRMIINCRNFRFFRRFFNRAREKRKINAYSAKKFMSLK